MFTDALSAQLTFTLSIFIFFSATVHKNVMQLY